MSSLMYYERLLHELNKLVDDSRNLEKERDNIYNPVQDKILENKDKIKGLRDEIKQEFKILSHMKKELSDDIFKDIENPDLKAKPAKFNVKKLLDKKLSIDNKEMDISKINEELKSIKTEHNLLTRPYTNKKRKLSETLNDIQKTIYRRIKQK